MKPVEICVNKTCKKKCLKEGFIGGYCDFDGFDPCHCYGPHDVVPISKTRNTQNDDESTEETLSLPVLQVPRSTQPERKRIQAFRYYQDGRQMQRQANHRRIPTNNNIEGNPVQQGGQFGPSPGDFLNIGNIFPANAVAQYAEQLRPWPALMKIGHIPEAFDFFGNGMVSRLGFTPMLTSGAASGGGDRSSQKFAPYRSRYGCDCLYNSPKECLKFCGEEGYSHMTCHFVTRTARMHVCYCGRTD